MAFYIRCPFYVSHKDHGASIVCEDTSRWFFTKEERNRQLSDVCTKQWKDCPYAVALTAFYEEVEDMNLTKREQAHLELTCESQKSELAKLKKQIHRMEKTIEEKERDINALEYLESAKDRQVKKQEERIMILNEEIKGLLAMVGYVTDAAGINDFTLQRVQNYGRKWDVTYRVDPYIAEDGVAEIHRVYIERKRKDDNDV